MKNFKERILRWTRPMLIGLLSVIGTIVALDAAFAGMTEMWVQRYNGDANGDDAATAMATDDDGNVYVTGSSISGNGLDYVTVKYNAGGFVEWVARYDGTAHSNDIPHAIVVHGDYVYVTGESQGRVKLTDPDPPIPPVTASTFLDFATVKYHRNSGTEMRVWRYDGSLSDDIARSITVDAAGNIYVTGSGTFIDVNTFPQIVHRDYVTIKYSPEEQDRVWVARFNGWGTWDDEAAAIAVDSDNNVYVTGKSMSTVPGVYDYATVKYNGATGAEIWNRRFNGYDAIIGLPANDQACAISVDANNNVIVTGTSDITPWITGSDYVTIKYDTDGTELWAARYNGTGLLRDIAVAVVTDRAGNAYVTGSSKPPATFPYEDYGDFTTVKYDANGNYQWATRYNGSSDVWRERIDEPAAMTIDPQGNIYVTGYVRDVIPGLFGDRVTLDDYATVMYNSSGAELWSARYSGPADGYYNAPDRASAIAVDVRGNVFVTGKSTGVGTGLDFTTIKYMPRDKDFDMYGENVDCNDNDDAIHPRAQEICDGKDNNCNGQIDEGLPILTYYRDADNDSYGTHLDKISACRQPAGYVLNFTDCDDTHASVHPGAVDVWGNGIDENCDGCDGDILTLVLYLDADGDGWGDPAVEVRGICQPPGGPGDPNLVVQALDCNDADPSVHPGAPEICDGRDNNCNGQVDEGLICITPRTCDVDKDGDIDQADLSLISRARGQTVQPGDLRDADGNGLISPNDVKVCIPQCTRPNCVLM